MVKIIQHHAKYKEIHGVDEIKLMTQSEHKILHHRLRREGKCKIPPKELHKISATAWTRTEAGKLFIKSKENRQRIYLYNSRAIQRIQFSKVVGRNIGFRETIIYNSITGNVVYSSGFEGKHGHKIPIIRVN